MLEILMGGAQTDARQFPVALSEPGRVLERRHVPLFALNGEASGTAEFDRSIDPSLSSVNSVLVCSSGPLARDPSRDGVFSRTAGQRLDMWRETGVRYRFAPDRCHCCDSPCARGVAGGPVHLADGKDRTTGQTERAVGKIGGLESSKFSSLEKSPGARGEQRVRRALRSEAGRKRGAGGRGGEETGGEIDGREKERARRRRSKDAVFCAHVSTDGNAAEGERNEI